MTHHCNEPGRNEPATGEAPGSYYDEELSAEPPWWQRPLTITLTTRHGITYCLDGVQDDTRTHLSSLDDVDKAALRVLLQQALREMDPPRATGGVFPTPRFITVNGGGQTRLHTSSQ